jgi:DMSO reductase family type II enzyme heme b subunit
MRVNSLNVDATELAQPDAAIWRNASGKKIMLAGVPVQMQPTDFIKNTFADQLVGKISEVQFKAFHNGEVIALHLEWADPNKDTDIDDNDHFPDGAALMFPFKGDAPLVTMGSKEQPVNAWHWRADRVGEARNNVAAGFGTSRVTSGAEIATSAMYYEDRWHVVFLRQLQRPGVDSTVQFSPGESIKVAFAVWEGSNGERAGLKAFSPQWLEITLA